MDPEKAQEEKGRDPRGSPRHRSILPMSLSLRPSSKRGSIINVVEPEPEPEPEPEQPEQEPEQQRREQATCQENIHYPVFDPQDPQHNIWLRIRFQRRLNSQTSSSETPKQPGWVQELPRRSLHKARSGFLALRAGLTRRSTRTESDLDNAGMEPTGSPEPEQNRRGGHGGHDMSGSTQADSSVGVRLHRTSTPWPSLAGTDSETSNRGDDSHEMVEILSATEADARGAMHSQEPAARNSVTRSPDEPPAYCTGNSRASDIRPPRYLATGGDGHYTYEHPGNSPRQHSFDCLRHLDNSGNLRMDASPRLNADSQNQQVAGPCGLCNPADESFGRKHSAPSVPGEASLSFVSSKIRKFRLSSSLEGASDIQPLELGTQPANALTELFERPPADLPSITLESDHARQQVSAMRDSELEVTQERGRLYQRPKTPDSGASFITQVTRASAEVGIAFPGVHQELVDQWKREVHQDVTHNPHTEGTSQAAFSQTRRGLLEQCERGPVQDFVRNLHAPVTLRVSQRSMDQETPVQQAPEMQPAVPTELSLVHAERAPTQDPINRQSRGASLMLSSRRQEMVGEESMWVDESRLRRFTTSTSRNPPWMAHSHPPTEAEVEANHSFGLHISLRNEQAETDRSRERGFAALRQQVSFRTPYDYQHSPFSPDTTTESPFGDSSCGSTFTRNSNTSAVATSRSSLTSNHGLSPLDSPIDEEVLFSSSLRDEYYMVDGKTSSFYPDRGDQPVKAVWQQDDGADRVCGTLGLSWARPVRPRCVPELLTPTSLPSQLRQDNQASMEGRNGETVDDYFIQRYLAQSSHLK